MILYVAGPMTGYRYYNHPTFLQARNALTAVGYEVVLPADIADLKLIEGVDGIALLPGSAASRGAMREVEYFKSLPAARKVTDYVKIAPVSDFVAAALFSNSIAFL